MTSQVEITTGARLHFGILSHVPSGGREFGGAGLMINSPGFHLVVQPDDRDNIEADEPYRSRISQILGRIRASTPDRVIPQCRIRVSRSIPPHSGFGSGTQLGMAVSRALSILTGEDEADGITLARRVGRGARSAIGIHGFAQGGFLLDAGKADRGEIAPLEGRVEFPSDWRIVLAAPRDGAGLFGADEEKAFARLPGMSATTTQHLRDIATKQLLPTVAAADFANFSEALYEFGQIVGSYFAPAQGGVFANPLMCNLAEVLRARGIRGVGQSSWGPTLFALVADADSADKLAAELAADATWQACHFHVAAAMNHGATAQVTDS
ncbi:MAG: GHMP kinase [Planctomycetaceae bacterium]|nr:GHMP kinase [Planctomycetaceae bacterium]MBT6157447.1 GHMP kinase [Planctomycetaceae bacterium]MBT6486838.1 GHMP kinase [Planctomycetaceae bacterium]MBT6498161.1 GHMP kinase [Planctomycetaceae bacterium]